MGGSGLNLGVLSVLLGIGNPLGWGVRLGKEIVRLIPGMNPFSWGRDWILSSRKEAS